MNQTAVHILARLTVSHQNFRASIRDPVKVAKHRTAKQCYHCQGLGHVQADCPTLRISGAGTGGGRCYSCGQPGHLAVRASTECYRSSMQANPTAAILPERRFSTRSSFWCRPWSYSTSWWFRWWFPWRICRRRRWPSSGNMLQMWRTQSLRA